MWRSKSQRFALPVQAIAAREQVQVPRRRIDWPDESRGQGTLPGSYACRLVTVAESHPMTYALTRECHGTGTCSDQVEAHAVHAHHARGKGCPLRPAQQLPAITYPMPRTRACDVNLAQRRQLLSPYPVAESELLAVVAHHVHTGATLSHPAWSNRSVRTQYQNPKTRPHTRDGTLLDGNHATTTTPISR